MKKADVRKSSNSSGASLIFLEDIHIFGLANLLRRPIIVISLTKIKDIQPCYLRGIYLPLLMRPDDCRKDPILIAYHRFHFMPMLFPMDESKKEELNWSEKYFHFHYVDNIDIQKLSNAEYESFYKPYATSNKHIKFANALPLFDYNLEPLKIHFLKEHELKHELVFMKKYLNLVEMEIEFDEPQEMHSEYIVGNDKRIQMLCCLLNKDTMYFQNNAISTYLNFLNKSITDKEPPKSLQSQEDTYYLKCKVPSCVDKALESKTYFGYCSNCFDKFLKKDEGQSNQLVACANEQCANTVQLNAQNKICDHCVNAKLRHELAKQESMKNLAKKERLKAKLSRDTEVPIMVEPTAQISAYDQPRVMTSRSKLYNLPSFNNSTPVSNEYYDNVYSRAIPVRAYPEVKICNICDERFYAYNPDSRICDQCYQKLTRQPSSFV